MTTIATDGKSMAGDGSACCNDLRVATKRVKVIRLPSGDIVGFSGRTVDREPFFRWLSEGGRRPKARDMAALVLSQGKLLYFSDEGEGAETDIPAAVGSGSQIALGAMLAGAAPRRAVEIAAMRDPFTGGKITEETL